MARYQVYDNPADSGYLLDVQSNWLNDLDSRVVVPLLPTSITEPATRLNPVFKVKGQNHVMLTQSLAAFPVNELNTPVTDLSGSFDKITSALDMLFHGF